MSFTLNLSFRDVVIRLTCLSMVSIIPVELGSIASYTERMFWRQPFDGSMNTFQLMDMEVRDDFIVGKTI